MYIECFLVFHILKTIFVHLHELFVIEDLVLLLIVRILWLILLVFHNLNFLVLDVDVILFEFFLISMVDVLSLQSFHLLRGLVAELHPLLEHLFQGWALVNRSRRVTDLSV